jgi:hypothetical protein
MADSKWRLSPRNYIDRDDIAMHAKVV